MIYKDKNFAFKDLSYLNTGDVIDGCNCSQAVYTVLPEGIILRNQPNMSNTNYGLRIDRCFWKNLDMGLENLPTYSGIDPTCGPDVEMCRHILDLSKITIINCDNGDLVSYEDAREDVLI